MPDAPASASGRLTVHRQSHASSQSRWRSGTSASRRCHQASAKLSDPLPNVAWWIQYGHTDRAGTKRFTGGFTPVGQRIAELVGVTRLSLDSRPSCWSQPREALAASVARDPQADPYSRTGLRAVSCNELGHHHDRSGSTDPDHCCVLGGFLSGSFRWSRSRTASRQGRRLSSARLDSIRSGVWNSSISAAVELSESITDRAARA
jgi:hypothetical protein